MDYEQWTPLGRGDPLKNDPTYDYVPPVLERVHYWIDPALRKPDPPIPGENQKTEILLLGVSSKKPSTGGTSVADSRRDTYEPFLKFVDGPIFQSSYQRIARPHFSTYFPTSFYTSKSKPEKNIYVTKGEQRVPYTVLVPPPIPKKSSNSDMMHLQKPVMTFSKPVTNLTTTKSPVTETLTTPSAVTVQESNLIFQSSSIGGLNKWNDASNDFAESSNQVTWKTPHSNESDESLNIPLTPETFLEFHLNNTGNSDNVTLLYNVSSSVISTDTNIGDSGIMYKGQVSDGDMDIASTYVNIGKAEAQMDSSSGFGISSVSIEPPQIMIRQSPVIMNAHSPSLISKPIPMHTLQTMQTMQPPLVSKPGEKKYASTNTLLSLLKKEITKPIPTTTSKFIPTSLPYIKHHTTTPIPSSTISSLTTDPLFKHYKQPSEPLKGPMYLIIQGHSKVKTYGPSKQLHGIKIQETNEIFTSDEKNRYTVKHIHNFKKEGSDERVREGRSNNLQSLKHVVKAGLGAINFNDFETNRRKDNDVQETELSVSYDVSSHRETSSEKYHKGIVEAARTIKEDNEFKQ